MLRALDIACLQTRPMGGFQAAIDEALPLAEAAVQAGADIIFLPEYAGGLRSEGTAFAPPSAPEDRHPFLKAMREFCARQRVWMQVGSIAVDGPDGKIINRGLMLDDAGQIRGRYDKIHLFDVKVEEEDQVYTESRTVRPGKEAMIVDTPFGRLGMSVCYDLRFPELYRYLSEQGAERYRYN